MENLHLTNNLTPGVGSPLVPISFTFLRLFTEGTIYSKHLHHYSILCAKSVESALCRYECQHPSPTMTPSLSNRACSHTHIHTSILPSALKPLPSYLLKNVQHSPHKLSGIMFILSTAATNVWDPNTEKQRNKKPTTIVSPMF